ncbi:NrfD/PsrC family molybdoenzyme membrane anchor subunit [Gordonibacter urolithinfaciens]|uniref:NrfD/PsrC family molybdoenzyme membrane anchor subunit n=2 Tax=Gordonibacter urolithinfaciens TaxID=1335613 RepID=UPI000F4BB343|nr:NrfD/PsrC family molybdoenzyme membrane anchor subunit [Gordonibacter urolithinfaciens]ROT91396.1 polysulfide reductase [Gordonibacter urolithinfaciens]GKG91380.1 hypothetical protein CE91St32_24230 [Gordonibacter pamelaeae]
MLGPLIVCYLFLGGTGAGACLVLAVLGMLAPRELVAVQGVGGCGAGRGPAGAHAVLRPPAPYRRLLAPGYAAALVALALGMVCLLADVGRADRLLLLLTSPALSHVAVGAWSLVVCAALAVLAGLAWAGLARRWRFAAVRVLQAALALAALVVMLYTGLLLQSLNAVPLWATPWLPALFVLSSLSCGMALVLAAAQLTGAAFAFVTVLGRLAAVDAAVVVLEALVLAAFVGTALAGIGGDFLVDRTAEALAASAEALVAGEAAWLFWGGFVLAGLAVPFALDVALARLRRPRPALALVAAACVLAGGLAMRFCVVEAGMHPLLAMAS